MDELYSVEDIKEKMISKILSFFRLNMGTHLLKNKKGETIQLESDLGFAFNVDTMNGVRFKEESEEKGK